MAEFQKAARLADVPPGTAKKIELQGKAIALFNVDGVFSAVSETCPHRGGPISEGVLTGAQVVCPWHGWTFDVTTGCRAGFPEGMGKITTYKVRVEGEDVLIEC